MDLSSRYFTDNMVFYIEECYNGTTVGDDSYVTLNTKG